MEKIIEITTSKFRQNQKKYFDLVSKGVQVIVFRGTDLFKIVPINKQRIFDEDTTEQIELSRKQIKEGKSTIVRGKKELDDFLNSL